MCVGGLGNGGVNRVVLSDFQGLPPGAEIVGIRRGELLGLLRVARSAACWAALALAAAPRLASGQAAPGYGDYLAWENWARVVPGEQAGLASSWDRAGGHFDANQYESPPGLIYGDLDVISRTITGPGIVDRFWMSHFAAVKPFVVQLYFDGESTPRISTDSETILSGAYSYFSAPLVNTFAGGQVCYEPIPFRDSLRIETRNRANLWHWYQYSFRTFAPGTKVNSYTGTLDASAEAARLATAAMFENAGQHPAGESPTAIRSVVGPASLISRTSLTVADLVGPGVIRRLNVRMTDAADVELDSLRLRVFYDQNPHPAIDAPIAWFFGAGHGRAPYKSLPLGTDSPDGFYCYWPMPFHEAARVELFNMLSVPVEVDSVVVEHESQPVGEDAGYLHVTTNHFRPNGSYWKVLASVTGTGHYVGNLLFIQQNYDSHYFLEGDELVVVDGADSLHGTGMEDAYNGGSYYNWVPGSLSEPEGNFPPFAFRPLSGILRVEKTASPPFSRADQYRWRIADHVPFTQSLEVTVETSYAVAYSEWTSAVFWYALPTVPSDAPSTNAPERSLGLELRTSEPNPVAETTLIRFTLPADASTTLDLLDVSGRRVERILEGRQIAGFHEVRWSRGSLPSGVYFLRLQAGASIETRKLVLIH